MLCDTRAYFVFRACDDKAAMARRHACIEIKRQQWQQHGNRQSDASTMAAASASAAWRMAAMA